MTTYRGSCHCGAITYEVSGELRQVEYCNCSLCERLGYLHWYVEPECFRLATSTDELETYQFGTLTSKNHFCRRCGISPYRRSRSDPHLVDINVRCLEDVDIDALPVAHFDGRNWEDAYAKSRS